VARVTLTMTTVIRSLLATVAAALILTSCGDRSTGPGDQSSSVPNDPALEAAAEVVRPMLERSFVDSFAGLELRHEVPLMVIYRKADPQLDAEVTRRAPEVQIEFRDATYALGEMKAAIERLFDDADYWRGQGTPIVSANPAVDGAGVDVTTSGDPDKLNTALQARYPTMSFTIRGQDKGAEREEDGNPIVPPVYSGPIPPLTGGSPP
jgi:hypothetical protein